MTSPFIPGARVAIEPFSGHFREAFVEKVHKNGNFTLRGDARRQQWRPYRQSWGDGRWTASKTGQHSRWSRETCSIWDASTDARIAKGIQRSEARNRLRAIQVRVQSLRAEHVSPETLDALEAALPPESA